MKTLIVIASIFLAGCSALKTNNAPTAYINGNTMTVSVDQQIRHQQHDLTQLKLLLSEFPTKAMDIEMSQPRILSQTGNQVRLEIFVKANFKQPWLINLWQNLYALGDPDGQATQISVSTAYDITGPDHWDTARYVRGTVKYADRLKYDTVMRELVTSNPTVRLTFSNRSYRIIHTQVVDMPALSHSYVDQTTPVFVDVGFHSPMRPINFDWPVAPIQMRIHGDRPIQMRAIITVDSSVLSQTSSINAQIIRQNAVF